MLDGRVFHPNDAFMSRIIAILLAACVSLSSPAQTFAAEDLARLFAGCVGRFSAEMEHAALMQRPEIDAWADHRSLFLTLLDATAVRSEARGLLAHRIDVKMAHSALLTLAVFGQDSAQSEAARDTADQYIRTCQAMVLQG